MIRIASAFTQSTVIALCALTLAPNAVRAQTDVDTHMCIVELVHIIRAWKANKHDQKAYFGKIYATRD